MVNPWFHVTSLLSVAALVSAAPASTATSTSTMTCYTNRPTTVTKLVTSTCPAPKTVISSIYLDASGNVIPPPVKTVYVTTLPAVTKVTQAYYASTMPVAAGETYTINGVTTVVASAGVISNCPCSKATTVVAPGPVITLPAAYGGVAAPVGILGNGNVIGNGNVVGNTVINTYVVYPSAFVGAGGETLTISGSKTVLPSATVISQCPCTQATAVTIVAPVTQYVPIIVIVGGATVTSTATVVSGVTQTQTATTTVTPTSGAGVPAARTYQTSVDGVTFLVEEQINYEGVPLALPAAKNKRQATAVDLQVCLKTCADAISCVGTSLNTVSGVCLYFSAIVGSTRDRDFTITFATVISRITPTGTSTLSTSSAASSTILASGTSTSGTSTSSNGGTSTSATSTSSAPSGTSTSGTATSSGGTSSTTGSSTSSAPTADPSSDPDVVADEPIVARAALPKPAGRNMGPVQRRGGILRRSNAEPAAKHVARKVVIEL